MHKQLILKNVFLGFLSWLIPFAFSFLFFKPNGEQTIPHDLFKAIMVVAGSISGCYLLVQYFKSIQEDFFKNGVVIGITWWAMNIALDSVVLIPMMKTKFATYFSTIGLVYIMIPTISVAMGYLLEIKVKN